MCQEFQNVNTKKLIQNTVHGGNLSSRAYPNLKKAMRSVGHMGLNPCEFLEPPNSTSARLSPSPSIRTLGVATQQTVAKSSSPVPPAESTLNGEIPVDMKNSVELSMGGQLDSGSRLDLPSAPSPGLVLFNNEEQSDMVFLVGKEENKLWRFPAHSFILEDSSPFFKALATARKEKAANNERTEIRVNWCEPETFHAILK